MGIGHVLSILLSDGIDVNINNSLNFNSKLFVSLNYFVLIFLTTNFQIIPISATMRLLRKHIWSVFIGPEVRALK